MQYVPEPTWILFLRILDEREAHVTKDTGHLFAANVLMCLEPEFNRGRRRRAVSDSVTRINITRRLSEGTHVISEGATCTSCREEETSGTFVNLPPTLREENGNGIRSEGGFRGN